MRRQAIIASQEFEPQSPEWKAAWREHGPSARKVVATWSRRPELPLYMRFMPALMRNQIARDYEIADKTARSRSNKARPVKDQKQPPKRKPSHVLGSLYCHNQMFELGDREVRFSTPKLGTLRTKRDWRYPKHRVLGARIRRVGRKWIISVVRDFSRQRYRHGDRVIGVDPGQRIAMTAHDGQTYTEIDAAPSRDYTERLQRRIAHAKRIQSRRERPRCGTCHRIGHLSDKQKSAACKMCSGTVARRRGSRRHQRAKADVNRLMRKLTASRMHERHTATRKLVETCSLIGFGNASAKRLSAAGRTESGNPRRTRKRHRDRVIRERSWYMLREQLEQKGAEHGTVVVGIDEAYTTQTCHVCGVLSEDSRGCKVVDGEKEWTCGACGERLHRDGNAAANIRCLTLASAPVAA